MQRAYVRRRHLDLLATKAALQLLQAKFKPVAPRDLNTPLIAQIRRIQSRQDVASLHEIALVAIKRANATAALEAKRTLPDVDDAVGLVRDLFAPIEIEVDRRGESGQRKNDEN